MDSSRIRHDQVASGEDTYETTTLPAYSEVSTADPIRLSWFTLTSIPINEMTVSWLESFCLRVRRRAGQLVGSLFTHGIQLP